MALADNCNRCRRWNSSVLECLPINENTGRKEMWFFIYKKTFVNSRAFRFFFLDFAQRFNVISVFSDTSQRYGPVVARTNSNSVTSSLHGEANFSVNSFICKCSFWSCGLWNSSHARVQYALSARQKSILSLYKVWFCCILICVKYMEE